MPRRGVDLLGRKEPSRLQENVVWMPGNSRVSTKKERKTWSGGVRKKSSWEETRR